MRLMYRKLIMAIIILLLIGNSATGVVAIQVEQSLNESQKTLTKVSVFAGSGDFDDWDGTASDASFRVPLGIAVLKDGSVLVADSKNHLIRKVKDGQVSTYAGFMLKADANGIPSGGWRDGTSQTAVFNGSSGMDTDSEGNVYIADTENHLIRKISKDGIVTTIAGDGILGQKDGEGSGARFYYPQDVAVAADGTLYVADTLNHSIRRITPGGQVTTLNAPSVRVVEVIDGYAVPAGDYKDGKLAESKFNEPTSIAIDNKGNLYVSDTGNHVIRYIDLAEGNVTTVAGLSQGELPIYSKGALYAEGGYVDGYSSAARFHSPMGIALTEEQGLIIADSLNHSIRYLVDGQVTTIAGVPEQFGNVDGINGHNLLHLPTDVAVLPNGNWLIADSYNNKIRELEFYELPSNLPQNNKVKVVYGDQITSFDEQFEIVNGLTMVPIIALSDTMGYEVLLDASNSKRSIELTKGDLTIKMQVGSPIITTKNAANNEEEQQEMLAAPYIKAGQTFVPVKYFSEAFGVNVEWDPNTRTVILREITEIVEKLPAMDRYTRTATLDQIKGTVWINQAGGSLIYRAYNGIPLHHGDRIATEYNSSAILKTVDRKDEITISENSELYISNLSNASHVKHTSLVLWNGMVGASVSSLVNSKDTFKIITPSIVTNVRGTQFFVGVDPITGNSSIFVGSGLVQQEGNRTNQMPSYVYPVQNLIVPGIGTEEFNVPNIVIPADFVKSASPAIIEALLKQIDKINQENAAMLEKLKNDASESNTNDNPFGLSQDDIEQYQHNMNHLLANILKQVIDQELMDKDKLQGLIDEINKNTTNKIDLDNVPPLQLTEQQKQQQEKQKQLEDRLKKLQEEQDRKREQQRQQAEQSSSSLLDKILAEKERLNQENKKQQEAAAKRAEELLKQKLSEVEKQKFVAQQLALEREKQQQEEAQRPKVPTITPESEPMPEPEPTPEPKPEPTPEPEPSPEPKPEPEPSNTAPKVSNPISNIVVNNEKSFEIDLSNVFSDDEGDTLTYKAISSNAEIANVKIEGAIVTITPNGIGSAKITITADDGNGGVAETSFDFGLYSVIANLRAEVSTNFIQLYWEYFKDEGLNYSIYIDDKLFGNTDSNHMELSELKPDTPYMLRVVAVNNDKEIVAYAELLVTTFPIES
ncbi:stalk domain-containing protein [Solibacillus sp. CAU 1738]|uniref:stalk domain-containing protein n=1 Tax=Solibacillus sp. CAU 1738 TaxID=3140363 RepID=UPI0032603AA0